MTRTARPVNDGPADDRIARPLTLVVGFDFSRQSALALEEAVTLGAATPPAALHVVGVLGHGGHGIGGVKPLHHIRYEEADAMQKRISAEVEATLARRGREGLRVFVHCRIGSPASQILGLAEEVSADLIIVGTHGRQGVERLLLGSVAEKVMRAARCPVLVMRPTEYDGAATQVPAAAEETEVAAADAGGDADLVPEPPCPACVARRFETGGAEWWCEPHGQAWVKPHRYAYTNGGIARMRPDEWILW